MFIASRADTSPLANRYVQVVLANPDVVVVQAALAGQLSGTWVFGAQQTGTAALPCRPNPGPVGKELTHPYEAGCDPHIDGVFDVNFGYLCGSNIGVYINLHRTDSAGLWQINAVATPDELGLVSKRPPHPTPLAGHAHGTPPSTLPLDAALLDRGLPSLLLSRAGGRCGRGEHGEGLGDGGGVPLWVWEIRGGSGGGVWVWVTVVCAWTSVPLTLLTNQWAQVTVPLAVMIVSALAGLTVRAYLRDISTSGSDLSKHNCSASCRTDSHLINKQKGTT